MMEKIQEQMPNFRRIEGTNLYRSSRPDALCGESLEQFLELDIHSIVDLRSMREFPSAKGPKLVDDHFQLFDVAVDKSNTVFRKAIGKTGKAKSIEKFCIDTYDGSTDELDENGTQRETLRVHCVFDMVSRDYAQAVMGRTNLATRGLLYSLYGVDSVFGTHLFLKSLVQYAINARGLLGQYKDIVDYCGQKIRLVLQSLSNKDKIPAMVNCTYGKDRTGIIVALALAVLGKSHEFIAEDYSKSAHELESRREVQGYLQQMRFTQSFYRSDKDTMIQLLQYVNEKYGSVEQYLEHIGFNQEWQQRLRESLLIKDDPTDGENARFPQFVPLTEDSVKLEV